MNQQRPIWLKPGWWGIRRSYPDARYIDEAHNRPRYRGSYFINWRNTDFLWDTECQYYLPRQGRFRTRTKVFKPFPRVPGRYWYSGT